MIEQPTATWSPKQERVALLIAAGRSIKVAATEADRGERTAHTWLELPGWHRPLDEEDVNRPLLPRERQSGLLLQMLQDQRLVAVLRPAGRPRVS